MSEQNTGYEYIIVGSGAGGGTLAARLAENGCKVLLLEAGGDPKELQGGNATYPDDDRLPDDYDVPVFHGLSNENRAMQWDFFVQHYEHNPERDKKYVREEGGVWYPRTGALGGCTAHNAMIMVYPHNKDWDDIADETGDQSWRADNMRKYFERMENCRYRPFPPWRWIHKLLRINPTRHGFKGWLSIEKAIPVTSVLGDPNLLRTFVKSAKTAFKNVGMKWHRISWLFHGKGDPNDWRLVKDNAVGLRYAPLSTHRHARTGTREYLRAVEKRHPDKLTIMLDALVTRVRFDDQNRAIGVEYVRAARQYQAHHEPAPAVDELETVDASREVILCGGAFNTPQLLMLSGIGPKKHLEDCGIEVRVPLAGVGRNLQDRYEVGVISRMKQDWKVLEGARFARGDPLYQQWAERRKGVYATNGAVVAVIKRSDPKRPLPDLFCFALLGRFPGYYPGFSADLVTKHNYLTWAVLKAHTNNTAGSVTLDDRAGKDPRDPRQRPLIKFRYFEEGNDEREEDIESVVDGVEFVRELTAPLADLVDEEEAPGEAKQTRAELRKFVADNAWGHHASCTCKIGPRDDPEAVLDNNFRVYGTQGLRVVDASVFPRIPGFFIVTSVYMVGEKAADVILADAGKLPPARVTPGWLGRWWRRGKRFLAKLWRWLWRPVAVVLAVLLLVVGGSWFIFEPLSRPNGPAEVREVTNDIVRLLSAKLKDQYGDAPAFLRDTHPKANACVRADFEVNEDLDEVYRHGVFQPGARYRSWLRFSNAADHVTPDTADDFRGLGLKLLGVPGPKLEVPAPELLTEFDFEDDDHEPNSQDFLFVAHDAFFAGNAKHFRDFFRAVVSGGNSVPDNPASNPALLGHLLTHPRGAFNAAVGTRTYPSIADIDWFSVAPFKLGEQVVKYVVTPCERPFHPPRTDDASADYLTGRLVDQLDPSWGGELCLDFNIQLRQSEDWPIDNTLIAWPAKDDEGRSTWQPVAKIHIRSQHFTTPEHEAFCENITFNPWHALPAHRPVGDLNEARRDVMFALQRVRLMANGLERFEPTGDECFYPGAKFPWPDHEDCRESAADEPVDPSYVQPESEP